MSPKRGERVVTLMFCPNCGTHEEIDSKQTYQLITAIGIRCLVCHTYTRMNAKIRKQLIEIYHQMSKEESR
ncbi:hypothetical protein [Aeribacillus pallidus]|uniref:hypothetical protein n=1 Tax=Aeribacillus pallidus TaxID=33936 RepID=UPI003D1995B4